MTNSTFQDLTRSGWSVSDGRTEWPDREQSVYSFEKTTDDGIWIVVSIHPNGPTFDVWSSAEHRLSGPCEAREASTHSLDDAIAAAKTACHEWDEDSGRLE